MEISLWFPNSRGYEITALFVAPDGWLNCPLVLLARGDPAPAAAGQDEQIAHQLEARGIASLLLDFGTPHGQPHELTIATLEAPIDDLGSAMNEIRLQRGIDVGRIGVAGSDLAGTAALLRASFDPRIRALALRAAFAPTAPPTSKVHCPTLIVVGDRDRPALNSLRRIEEWLDGPSEVVIVPNADHHFSDPAAFEVVARHTVDWFQRHLGSGAIVQTA